MQRYGNSVYLIHSSTSFRRSAFAEVLAQRKRTSSNSPFRQKIPALKPPLIKGLKMFCTQFFVTLAFAEVLAQRKRKQVSSPFVLSPLRSESVSFVAERGKIQIHLVFRSLIRTFATKVAKLLHLGIKKKQVSFVLHSIFRNFAAQNERYDETI